MGRTRDVSKILTSNTSILTLASASATYAPIAAGGLTLITSTSFPASATLDITGCFSSTYDHYLIQFDCTSATSYSLNARMLSGSTPATAGNYYRARLANNNATATVTTETSNTEATLTNSSSTSMFGRINIFYPFNASNTYLETWVRYTGADATVSGFYLTSHVHTLATSYDGIRLYSNSPNFSGGTAKVYGYRK